MRKLDGAVTAGGSVGRVVRWPVFFALNIDTPNRWEDLYKEAIARDILISIRALPPNKSMQPTAKASAD